MTENKPDPTTAEDFKAQPVYIQEHGKVRIGEHEFTVVNMRVLNVMNDHIHGEQTADLQLTLVRLIPKDGVDKS